MWKYRQYRHIGNHQYRRIGISAKMSYRHTLTKYCDAHKDSGYVLFPIPIHFWNFWFRLRFQSKGHMPNLQFYFVDSDSSKNPEWLRSQLRYRNQNQASLVQIDTMSPKILQYHPVMAICTTINWVRKHQSQLEVQWAYSGHLVHLQWGTVHALYAIYSGHCGYTVARNSVHTVVTYSGYTVYTLYPHCSLQCAL